jgi:hypothetical protein
VGTWVSFWEEIMDKDQAQMFCRLTETQIPVGSRWRHYKGGIYQVIAVSCMEVMPETILVTYRSEAYGTCWTRSADNWLDHDWAEGEPSQHRFTRMP